MICESCLCQAHRLHYTKAGKICDECLTELPEYDARSTRQMNTLPQPADECTEEEGNRTDQIDGHTTAHFAMLAMTGQCPWCGAESEVEFSSKVTP